MLILGFSLGAGMGIMTEQAAAAEPEFTTVEIISTADGERQKALRYIPQAEAPVPLLVVLHTWSFGYEQKGFGDECLVECARRGWALIQPDFRGENIRPEACASDLAVQDVLDAVASMRAATKIDAGRIYAVGTSGGGHMSLVMAQRAPELWAGISAWVPISDLAAWHAECIARKTRYAGDLNLICGGPPGTSQEVDLQYHRRSPLFYLQRRAQGMAIDINAGIDDGHTGAVPVSQSLRAFNELADGNGAPEKKLSDAQIEFFTTQRAVPEGLRDEKVEESRQHPVLFRREAGPARVTIFAGGHEGDMGAAVNWLAAQRKRAD